MGETREITFRPAFHRCHPSPSPSQNYGIGGVEATWVLRKDGCAITWRLFTDWGLPDEEFKAACPNCEHPSHQSGYPSAGRSDGASGSAGEVRWHLPHPMFDDQAVSDDNCTLVGGPCWADVGYLIGDEVFNALRIHGGEAVWAKLAELLDQAREAAPA